MLGGAVRRGAWIVAESASQGLAAPTGTPGGAWHNPGFGLRSADVGYKVPRVRTHSMTDVVSPRRVADNGSTRRT
jgi:hypothetical protein